MISNVYLERISRQEAAELEEDERGEAKEEWTSEEDSDHISIFRSATDMENRILDKFTQQESGKGGKAASPTEVNEAEESERDEE